MSVAVGLSQRLSIWLEAEGCELRLLVAIVAVAGIDDQFGWKLRAVGISH